MKKLTLTSLFIVLFLAGFAQVEKVILISFWADRQMDPGDFGSGLTASIATLTEDEDFNTQKYVDDFYKIFTENYQEKFPFEMMDESLILEAEGYENILDDVTLRYPENRISTVNNFQPIIYQTIIRNKSAIPKAFEMVPEADLVMIVQLGFRLVKKMQIAGFGTGAIYAYTYISGVGKDGKLYLKINEGAQSDNTFKFALGGAVFDTKEIQALCDEAVKNLFSEMEDILPKRIKKMEKKLKRFKK